MGRKLRMNVMEDRIKISLGERPCCVGLKKDRLTIWDEELGYTFSIPVRERVCILEVIHLVAQWSVNGFCDHAGTEWALVEGDQLPPRLGKAGKLFRAAGGV